MLNFASVRRVFIAKAPQDMRRGIDTLASVVASELGEDPYAGDCFVFLGRDRRRLKVLVWEEGGFWLCQKRLECGTFADPARWSTCDGRSVVVSAAQMHALLEGIDVRAAHYRRRQGYRPDRPERFVKYGGAQRSDDDACRGGSADRAAARGAGAEGCGAGGGEAHDPRAAAAHPRHEVGALGAGADGGRSAADRCAVAGADPGEGPRAAGAAGAGPGAAQARSA